MAVSFSNAHAIDRGRSELARVMLDEGLCPLLGQIEASKNVDQGVVFTPSPDVHREALLAHMRCHVAFAATAGFEGMNACPLYVKGVTVDKTDAGIVMRAPDAERVKAVQERTASHVE